MQYKLHKIFRNNNRSLIKVNDFFSSNDTEK